MYQAIAKRDDKEGYKLFAHNLPKRLTKDSIIFLPELSTSLKKHIKYLSKFTMQDTGDLVIKLVRSDGFDPFDRPKSLAHNIIVSSEEYNFNSLDYFASPLIYSDIFDNIENEPQILDKSFFKRKENKILEKISLKALREIIVSVMTQSKVILHPKLDDEGLIELASVIDKAVPYEASYDFSLITYSTRNHINKLVFSLLYVFPKELPLIRQQHSIQIKNKNKKIEKMAKEYSDYLDEYIELIINQNYEKLLAEHAKFVIGMYHDEMKSLQNGFIKRYQLDMPFNMRNKFQAKLAKYFSSSYV